MSGTDERLFLRVVEAGSLKAAAEALGTDPSTVSRRLAALEARLGVKLLERSTRRSRPTDAGARYYEGLRRLVEAQDALEAEVSGTTDTVRGRLRVTAPVDFGARFVVPVVARLQRDAPQLEVELELGSGMFDLVERGLDVAIRIGRLPDSSLLARRLGAVPRVLVASPGYLERHGEPRSARELEGHEFVLYVGSSRGQTFEVTAPDGAVHTVAMRGRVAVNSMTGIRALVEDGAGLSLGPRWAFEASLAAGRVRAVLPECGLRAFPLHAVTAPSSYVPARVRAFVERMAEQVRAEPTLEATTVRAAR